MNSAQWLRYVLLRDISASQSIGWLCFIPRFNMTGLNPVSADTLLPFDPTLRITKKKSYLLTGSSVCYLAAKFSNLNYNNDYSAYDVIFCSLSHVFLGVTRKHHHADGSLSTLMWGCCYESLLLSAFFLDTEAYPLQCQTKNEQSLRLCIMIKFTYFIFYDAQLSEGKDGTVSRLNHRQSGEHACASH